MTQINEIRTRIQFLVTIQIFFVVLLRDLFSNNDGLTWGIGVAFYVIIYLLVGLLSTTKEKILNIIRHLISLNIVLYVFPILLVIILQKGPIPGDYTIPVFVTFAGTLWLPMIMFFVVGITVMAQKFKFPK